jgi:beta-phosphoglucomutase-like phosphatase (HAD superfamily)
LKQKSPIHLDVSNWGAAIFDMDGVVVDTVPIHFRAWKKMAEDYARAFTFEDYKAKVDGIPRIDGARAILEGMDEETVLAASDKKQHYFLELLGKEEIPTYPSTLDLITELRRLQIRVAVISSSKNAPLILERIGLAHDIDALISGGDIQRGKPDPAPGHHAGELHRLRGCGSGGRGGKAGRNVLCGHRSLSGSRPPGEGRYRHQ